ncbi:DUF5071 domain-containing protein [Chitinophaga pinensis]|uniref:DUF5071 domain-containing protein n=1 Tax=Chitinophaga pinensis (strain ATCC 43595 / DSM 2588 / LMG 13176 / NBRC 15968 / NCIMB 11800 / UQM 2034) TaxID=485918 RepID=A0A979G863_CHIPD|nr:DUF5071 domain-containing protein [Chitinophaga pinensis]ACU62423.1 hypothetical protein Cpin_4990 [Chitinophaga pinensis DSM 2588]
MGNSKPYIPKTKFDDKAVALLRTMTPAQIREDVPALLTWLQDLNWPIASDVSDYLIPYVNDIKNEILDVFRTYDETWKRNVLCLLGDVPHQLDEMLLLSLKRMASAPTPGEKEEEIDLLAIDILLRQAELRQQD